MRGQAYMVRYADDIIFCFQYEEDVKRFYKALKGRLKKFNLELSEEKTKIVKLTDDQDNNGNRTFDFLGFTHYMGKCRDGIKRLKRKTSSKRFRKSIRKYKKWIKNNRTTPIKEFMKKLNRKIVGTYNYYSVSVNFKSIRKFYRGILHLVFKWLNRRSQKKSFSWDKYKLFLKKYTIKRPSIKVNLY